MALYTCKDVIPLEDKVKALTRTVKELLKLLAEAEKLIIIIISIVGWILILIKLFA
jgi:uncharacterized membrane protein